MTDSAANPGPPIDRAAPARRPDRRAVMYQKWRSLLFLHWAFPPEAIRPMLPTGLDLDVFAGEAYVGLVPFTMNGIRPVGLPAVPWLSSFHETNVRTYVHAGGRDPGVWFFSLDAANPLAVALARAWFHLPYYHARMSLVSGPDGRVSYRSRRVGKGPARAASSVDCRVPAVGAAPAVPGTLDHFLLERYLLYTTYHGRTMCGQVHHTPYPVQVAEVIALEETLLAASGLERPPLAPLAHFAAGVDVEIFPLERSAHF
jgi:uncharacterized protein YqjF (DUF2071 family)